MLSELKSTARKVRPKKGGMVTQAGMIALLLVLAVGPAAAQGGNIPYDQIVSIFDIIVGLIIAVALVNGAVGLLQYMTAGSNVERSSAGKERLFKTFAALIGAAVLKGLVTALGGAVASGAGGDVENPLGG